jgi:hypothetical protein
MGIIFVIIVFLFCGWIIISTIRKLIDAHKTNLWLAGFLLTVIGLTIGHLLANQEYHAGSSMRIAGIPMPLVFFHFENGQWVDFPLPAYVGWPGYVTNILFWIAICLLPLRLRASVAKHKP